MLIPSVRSIGKSRYTSLNLITDSLRIHFEEGFQLTKSVGKSENGFCIQCEILKSQILRSNATERQLPGFRSHLAIILPLFDRDLRDASGAAQQRRNGKRQPCHGKQNLVAQ